MVGFLQFGDRCSPKVRISRKDRIRMAGFICININGLRTFGLPD